MNTGAFGENFPYSNFHDMNLDWVIKIAKDFLDQYTSIQDLISEGLTNIENLTDEELQALQDKADALETALTELFNQYTDSMDSQLTQNITTFDTHADQKGTEVIASIPADYTDFFKAAIKGNKLVTPARMATVLPDFNDALSNSMYVLNFAAEDTKPTHAPVSDVAYDMAILLTSGDDTAYKTQILYSKDFMYKRTYNGSVWGNWLYIKTLNADGADFFQGDLLVTPARMASVLPDFNSAINNSVYVLNFASADTKPSHYPTNSAYDMAILITTGDNSAYKTQLFYSKDFIYKRTYSDSWGDWVAIPSLYTELPSIFKGNLLVTPARMASVLPDLDDARNNSVYTLNFSGSDTKPDNIPNEDAGYSMSLLITTGDNSIYRTQWLLDKNFTYIRIFDGTDWGDWSLYDNKITADPNTLIHYMKTFAKTGKTLYLDSGLYDLYQMYIDYYGDNYWTNYNGYTSDPFSEGLLIDGINLVGTGKTIFRFTGSTTTAIQNYMSFFVLKGNASLENIQINLGNDKLRYAIHDDSSGDDSRILMRNIVILGTPHYQSQIGGGCGRGTYHMIENCIFGDNSADYDITYHSNSQGGNRDTIQIANCFGSKKCSFWWYGIGTEKNYCIVQNSKFSQILKEASTQTPHDVDNITLYKYCNEEDT